MKNFSTIMATLAIIISISALVLVNGINTTVPTKLGADGDTGYTNIVTTGDITVGDDLTVTDDAVVSGDLAVTGAMTTTGDFTTKVKVDISLTGSTTLTAAQTGTIFSIATSTGFNITLPSVTTKGLMYTFVVGSALATTNLTINSHAGDDIEGSIIVAGAVVDCAAADVLTFVIDGENIGDFVTVVSNGTYWVPLESGVLTASKLTCSG